MLDSQRLVFIVNPTATATSQGTHWVCVVLDIEHTKVMYYDSYQVSLVQHMYAYSS